MPGSFSGNGSVQWLVDVYNKIGTPENEDKGGGRHHQAGRDLTPQDRYFKVVIKCPRSEAQWRSFVERLENQAQIARNSLNAAIAAGGITDAIDAHGVITLFLPIEDMQSFTNSTDNQIFVDWPILPASVTS
jgi:hypothetical protein